MNTPDEPITTADVMQVLSLSGGGGYGFKVVTDRRVSKSGLTKGKSAGMVVADTLPELLRHVANFAEQNGGTLESVAEGLRELQLEGSE